MDIVGENIRGKGYKMEKESDHAMANKRTRGCTFVTTRKKDCYGTNSLLNK